jgi:hypothetical protein
VIAEEEEERETGEGETGEEIEERGRESRYSSM